MDEDLRVALTTGGGVIARRRHPELAKRLDRALARGEVVSLLPGVCVLPALVDIPEIRIAAGAAWSGPDSVVCGLAAARLTFWRDCRLGVIELAVRRRAKTDRGEWRVRQRRIPAELIIERQGLRYTSPALTAVDLAVESIGGDVIDRVLRKGSATLAQIRQALELTPARAGNPIRAQLLEDSRDEPWSEAERAIHGLLRSAGIGGWSTNAWIAAGSRGCFVDVLFERERVVLEVDGWDFHSSRQAFEDDRRRRNALVLAGYLVLNFTWRQIIDDPDWVLDCIVRAVGSVGYPSARKM